MKNYNHLTTYTIEIANKILKRTSFQLVGTYILNIILSQSRGRGTKKCPGDVPRTPTFRLAFAHKCPYFPARPLALPRLRRPWVRFFFRVLTNKTSKIRAEEKCENIATEKISFFQFQDLLAQKSIDQISLYKLE